MGRAAGGGVGVRKLHEVELLRPATDEGAWWGMGWGGWEDDFECYVSREVLGGQGEKALH